MGVLSSPISGDEKGEVNQSFQEQKKENNPVVESLIEPEDSFVDSLLDLDFLRDWMDSDGVSESPVHFSPEKVELNVMEGVDMKCDASAEERIAEECLKLDVTGDVEPESCKMETGGDVSCGKAMVEEGAAGDGCCKLGNLRCLIEEEMGKVNLDGASNCPVSNVSIVSAIECVDLDVAKKIAVKEGGVDNIVQSVGVVNAVGSGNEIVVTGEDGGVQPVSVDGNAAKNHDQESDGDESDNDSESDDESESSSCSSFSSSSSSDDDDDDDDDEEEEEEEEEMGKRTGHAMLGGESKDVDGEGGREREEGEIVISDNEDGSDGGDIAAGPIRSKNEITALPPVPPVNVALLPHHKTLPVGAVLSILGSQVIIEGIEQHNPLNEGSILWITESRSPLGIVDEIFGQVKSPHYIVRYNSDSEVPTGIQPGTLVSFVPEFANHVLNDKTIYQKGYDASGANDEEVLDEEEFSDDEKEAEHKRLMKMKMKKRGTNDEKVGNKNIDQKKSKNRRGKWKPDQSAAANPQIPLGQCNDQSSSGQGYGVIGQPGMVPPFAQRGPNPSFIMPSDRSSVIPFQVPWMQMVHPQPIYQMCPPSGLPYQQTSLQSGIPFQQRPLQSGLPFQQQIDPGPNLPLNPILSGGQSGFNVMPPGFLPQPTFLNQGMHNNHSPFGMGTPGQHTPLPMNLGEQAMPPNLPPQIGYNQSFQPDNPVSGNTSMPRPRFNHSRYSSGGGHKKSHGRGGGRFGPGRGRQQKPG